VLEELELLDELELLLDLLEEELLLDLLELEELLEEELLEEELLDLELEELEELPPTGFPPTRKVQALPLKVQPESLDESNVPLPVKPKLAVLPVAMEPLNDAFVNV
jgi:hypothetical protein